MMFLRVSTCIALVCTYVCAYAASDPAQQFLAGNPIQAAAVIKTQRVETKWIILEGDHIPFSQVSGTILQLLKGTDETLTTGATIRFLQFDYTDMLSEPISAPAMEEREYLVLLNHLEEPQKTSWNSQWMALPHGVLLVRGQRSQEFIWWDGTRYNLSSITKALRQPPLPLSEIVDAATRLNVAEQRIREGSTGDVSSFVRGLVENVRNYADKPHSETRADQAGENPDEQTTPHQIYYQSLVELGTLAGKFPATRELVIGELKGLTRLSNKTASFVAALLLAQLGDSSGSEQLMEAVRTSDNASVSEDRFSAMTFYGSFKFDGSRAEAAAYALGFLGNPSALDAPTSRVQMAAVDGLLSSGLHAGREKALITLRQLAAKADADIARLDSQGMLSARRDDNDETTRYPDTWTKVHALLAATGDDESLQKLIRAWARERKTFTTHDDSPMAGMKIRIVRFDDRKSGWPGLIDAIYEAEVTTVSLLQRARRVVNTNSLAQDTDVQKLMQAIERASAAEPTDEAVSSSTLQRIEETINSGDTDKRADALAACGRYKIDKYFDSVLRTAIDGSGPEAMASIYGLGLYNRDILQKDLLTMISSGTLEKRLSAFELATRKQPERFTTHALELLHEVCSKDERVDAYARQLPRLLCRVCRRGIPNDFLSALQTANSRERAILITTIRLSGDPSQIPELKRLGKQLDASTSKMLQRTIDSLGPLE